MNNKIKILSTICILLLMGSSCKKSLNSLFQNPDAFTTTNIELLFPQGVAASVPLVSNDTYNRTFGSFAPMEQLSVNNSANPVSLLLYEFVQATSGSSAGQVDFGRWAFYYNTAMPQLKEIEKIYNWQLTPAQQQGYQVYYWLTKIIEAYNTAQATDLFGDMPYSQAFTARNSIYNQPVILNPKYDAQQNIYDSILTDLHNAANFLDTAHLKGNIYPAQAILPTQDVIFGGVLSSWNSLANSLRLRYAMRISGTNANPTRAVQEITDIVNNNRPLILADSNNAVITNTAATTSTGLFYGVTALLSSACYAPAYMDSIMVANADPRLKIFFYTDASNKGVYTGMPASYGLRQTIAATPVYKGQYAFINPLTFGYNLTMPVGIMVDAADVNFLLAEAAKKGFITGGDATAAQYYNTAIQQSVQAYYSYYATAPATTVVGTGANAYTFTKVALTAPTAAAVLTWINGSGYAYNSATALAQIAQQKWMHDFILEMDENYAEFRRLGMPKLPADIYLGQQLNTVYPARVPYPSSEQSLNTINFSAAAAATNNNSYAFPVWWNH